MSSKNVFQPIAYWTLSQQQLKTALPSLAFLKQKFKADGTPDKVKARLVAGGHRQDRSLFEDVGSPTADITHIFTEAAIAASKNQIILTADVGAAYLNAPMEGEEVLMKVQPPLSEIMTELHPEYEQFVDPHSGIIGEAPQSTLWLCSKRKTLVSAPPCNSRISRLRGKQI